MIKQGNIFGRVGTGIGKGLAEQVPKEIERGRLASGLKELGEQKGLSPFQQFTGLASTPGITPQMLQSGSDILRQQNYLDAIKNQYGNTQQKNNYIPSTEELKTPVQGEIPTLSTPEATAQSYKEYIPPTEQQERADAAENFNKNPARYEYDFEKALKERKEITARNQEIQKAHQTQEATAVAKEEKLKGAFDKEAQRLGINTQGEKPNFHPKIYQKFEEDLIKSILPKADGGEGLTQEQAVKKYSKILDQTFRDYQDLGSLSSWSPREFDRQSRAIQKNFEKIGAQQTMMDELITRHELAPMYAAHKAYPIKKGEMKALEKIIPTQQGLPNKPLNDVDYAKMKQEMGNSGSPLSIAYEIDRKGYSPRGWLDYLNKNRDTLQGWQLDQLKKPIELLDLKTMWLKSWENEHESL